MKKNLFMIFILVAFSLTLKAQRFQGGLLGGFNGTQVDGDRYRGYHKPGLLAGFFVQTALAPAVFAAMGLKYS